MSEVFEIKLKPISDGSSIDFEKTEYTVGETLNGSIQLIDDKLTYQLYFVNGENKTQVNVNSDYTFTLESFENVLSNGYFELVLTDGIQTKTVISKTFNVKEIQTNQNNQISDSNDDKGCKACNKKNIGSLLILNLMLTSCLVICRKKYKK